MFLKRGTVAPTPLRCRYRRYWNAGVIAVAAIAAAGFGAMTPAAAVQLAEAARASVAAVPLQEGAADKAMAAEGAAGRRLVVFDAEFLDTSLQTELFGEDPAEQARLAMIGDILRTGARQSPQYELIEVPEGYAPLETLRQQVRFLHDCNDCELGVARALGAELAAIVWVQKVSDLIINLNVVIKDVDTGAVVRTAFVDIRGNTDASWRRGAEYMVEHRLTGGGR